MEQDSQPQSTAENPLVSVIVRTKDRPKLLKKALASIAGQTYRPIEVVLVNDGGCDLDVEKLKSVLGDVSLNYQRLEKNTGRAHAGNVGIENTKGKYVGFLDDDDEFYPEHVSVLAALLYQIDFKVVYSNSEIVFTGYDPESGEFVEKEKRLFSSRDFVYEELFVGNYIPLISLLFNKEVLRFAEGFDEAFDLYEDWDLLIRTGQKYPFYHVSRITSRYIQWSKELQIAQSEKFLSHSRIIHDKVLSKNRDKITPDVLRYVLGLREVMAREKDAVIADKDAHIRNLAAIMENRDAVIADKDAHIRNLEAIMENRDAVIADKDAHIRNLAAIMENRDAVIADKDAHIRNLEAIMENRDAVIADKDAHIQNLEAIMENRDAVIADKDAHIQNLEAETKNKDNLAVQYKSELIDKDTYYLRLESEIDLKDSLISDKDALITAMKNTLGWRILEKYRRVRNSGLSFVRVGENYKNLIVKGFRVIKDEGVKYFLKKANKKLLFRKAVKISPGALSFPCILVKSVVDRPIEAKVSVIIPTKNAGEEFDYTLRRVFQQEGIGEIELVIVDSGSKDRTIEISKAYTNNIVQILPEDFHHARTRNLGSEKASGDFLVFTVQDAFPVGNHWLYKLLTPVNQGLAAAASCRQVPRSDADLFACWESWAHYNYLGHDRDIIQKPARPKDFDKLDIPSKRALAALDNVALGIRKSVFDKYLFDAKYAEDLELGMRLIKDGHSLMFQMNNAVVHSHNRSAIYFLKRGYVDTISLSEMFRIDRKNVSFDLILESLSFLYRLFTLSTHSLNLDRTNAAPDVILRSFMDILKKNIQASFVSSLPLNGDPMLDSFFEEIPAVCHRDITTEACSILKNNLFCFSEFVKIFDAISNKRDDFENSLFKFFGNTAGHYLASNTSDKRETIYEGV
jgi:glycosyltransferase involved in cell wall biosynthesis